MNKNSKIELLKELITLQAKIDNILENNPQKNLSSELIIAIFFEKIVNSKELQDSFYNFLKDVNEEDYNIFLHDTYQEKENIYKIAFSKLNEEERYELLDKNIESELLCLKNENFFAYYNLNTIKNNIIKNAINYLKYIEIKEDYMPISKSIVITTDFLNFIDKNKNLATTEEDPKTIVNYLECNNIFPNLKSPDRNYNKTKKK